MASVSYPFGFITVYLSSVPAIIGVSVTVPVIAFVSPFIIPS